MDPQAPPTAAPARPAGLSRLDRTGSAVCAAACLGVLGLAAWMDPHPDGHATHTQLGLPSCQWVAAMGKPCPTCGMTTAFAHAADGCYAQAAATQPFGLLLALGAATVFWGALHGAITGVRVPHIALRAVNGRSLLALLGLGLAAWAYKLATWTG